MTDTNESLWQRILGPVRNILRWPPVRPPASDLREKTQAAQLRLVVSALGGGGGRDVGGGLVHEDENGNSYLAHPSRVILTREAAERLGPFFEERQDDYDGTGFVDPERPVVGDVVLYNLPSRTRRSDRDLELTLRDLDGYFGDPRVAGPDHILYVTPGGTGHLCPAAEPEPPPGSTPVPAPRPGQAETNVRVSVVDTGWDPHAAANKLTTWLSTGYIGGDDDPAAGSTIGPYGGHGTFVAGVVRCLAPGVRIEHEGVLNKAGACYESEISAELNEAMHDRPDLISISAGCYTRLDLGLIGFEALSAAYDLENGEDAPLVVAAAGNDYGTRTFWPAAYEWVLAVGALEPDPRRIRTCDFSNVSQTWVDVYAQGRDLVNAFPSGTYAYTEPANTGRKPQVFSGLAKWSGTSFATPIVTGLIADHLAGNPQATVRDARDAVLKTGRRFTDSRVKNGLAVGPPYVDGN